MKTPIFAIVGCLIVASACWDFAALLQPTEPAPNNPDASMCVGNALAEDCANGIDDNANCLVDCKDPACKWDRACRPDLAEPVDLAEPADLGTDLPAG